jgi:hypothetical protein
MDKKYNFFINEEWKLCKILKEFNKISWHESDLFFKVVDYTENDWIKFYLLKTPL